MELEGLKIAVLAEDMYEELELWYPYYRFKEAGADVKIIGTGRVETFTSKHGYPATAELDIHDARVEDFDAVAISGGFAPDMMRRVPAMVDFVRDMDAAGKVVGSICHAGSMLVSANIVRDRRATSFFAIKDDLIAAGADWVDEEVVIDGNLVTSRRPVDLPAYCRGIIQQLVAQRNAD